MPTNGQYLCGCGRFMRPEKNGVTVEELMEDGAPYRLWDADLWACPECGARIVSGFGREPLAEHYQPNYQEQRERLLTMDTDHFYQGRCAAKEA